MNFWLISIKTVLIYVSVAYIISRILKRNDIMDILWGPGFAIIAFVCNPSLSHYNPQKVYLLFFIVVWALRLSLHISIKNAGKPEDFRYKNWRESWGSTEWWRSYLQIYLLQGFFMLIIALPIIAFMSTKDFNYQVSVWASPYGITRKLGIFLIIFGFFFESTADFQKSRFKNLNPTGLMKTGLWKISRHPNYFGEAVFWWGIAFYTFGEVNLLFGIISAFSITLLLRYVSGVPMLEKSKEGNAAYEQYKKETSVFIPFLKP
jgi:steroid 5-alpha reductase family enzyme